MCELITFVVTFSIVYMNKLLDHKIHTLDQENPYNYEVINKYHLKMHLPTERNYH